MIFEYYWNMCSYFSVVIKCNYYLVWSKCSCSSNWWIIWKWFRFKFLEIVHDLDYSIDVDVNISLFFPSSPIVFQYCHVLFARCFCIRFMCISEAFGHNCCDKKFDRALRCYKCIINQTSAAQPYVPSCWLVHWVFFGRAWWVYLSGGSTFLFQLNEASLLLWKIMGLVIASTPAQGVSLIQSQYNAKQWCCFVWIQRSWRPQTLLILMNATGTLARPLFWNLFISNNDPHWTCARNPFHLKS